MNVEGEVRLEVNLRELHPPAVHDRQEMILDRLRRLEAEGQIRTVTVNVWGKQLPTDPGDRATGPTARACERLEAYERWAERTGHDLSPAFERKTLPGPIGEDAVDHVVVVPQISAAIYEEDDLCGVYPCRDGRVVYTIGDMIDLFEAGAIEAVERHPTGDPIAVD